MAHDNLSPQLAVMMADELRQLLNELDDSDLQDLATAKLEGYTNGEIAQQLECSLRTVERRLQLIRKRWQQFEA